MLGLFIFIALTGLFVRQFYGSRPAKWGARVDALRPVGRYLLADLRALRPQRKTQEVPVYSDEDIRRMLGL